MTGRSARATGPPARATTAGTPPVRPAVVAVVVVVVVAVEVVMKGGYYECEYK